MLGRGRVWRRGHDWRRGPDGRRRGARLAAVLAAALALAVPAACSGGAHPDAGGGAAAPAGGAPTKDDVCSQLLATTARITQSGQLSDLRTAATTYRDGAAAVRRVGHELDGPVREAADETAFALDVLANQIAQLVPGRLGAVPSPRSYALAAGRLRAACGGGSAGGRIVG